MREGVEFYTVNGKRSLSKSGSEFLCALYQITITFERDTETLESFKSVDGLVAFVATMRRGEQVVGQGRGCALLSKNGGDHNKTTKMAQKSAATDGTLRSLGLSAYFSQDLETMPAIQTATATEESPDLQAEMANIDDHDYPAERSESEQIEEGEYEEIPVPISERQESYLRSLAMQNLDDGREKEEYLANIQSLSKSDACSAIKAMLLATSSGR